jgi:uncharacterized protein YjiS (DUF1127 family)
MDKNDVLKRLRAWVYLRAPVADWTKLGITERAVLRIGVSREKLVLVAMASVFSRIRGRKEIEARRELHRLVRELKDLGLSEEELQRASETLFSLF